MNLNKLNDKVSHIFSELDINNKGVTTKWIEYAVD